MDFLHSNTPVESYDINGKHIAVKRDDLCPAIHGLPHLAKMRGIVPQLLELQGQGVEHVGVFDTRISRAGQGVAVIAFKLGMYCTVYYPQRLADKALALPVQQRIAVKYRATLHPIPATRTAVMYNMAKSHAKQEGITLLPLGLVSKHSVAAVAREAATVDPVFYSNGTIVCCVGSGTMLSGIILGLRDTASNIIAVNIGMASGMPRVMNTAAQKGVQVTDIPAQYDYYEPAQVTAPFSCDPHYDAKAWEWLENVSPYASDYLDPVLFWNIGGNKEDEDSRFPV